MKMDPATALCFAQDDAIVCSNLSGFDAVDEGFEFAGGGEGGEAGGGGE